MGVKETEQREVLEVEMLDQLEGQDRISKNLSLFVIQGSKAIFACHKNNHTNRPLIFFDGQTHHG